MQKGICRECGESRWLGGQGRRCKPCAYPVAKCVHCHRCVKIYVDRLCYLCYQDRQVGERLQSLDGRFTPASQYNQQLFSLYLTYIRRYRLFYHHVRQAQELGELLERQQIQRINTWSEIYRLMERHPLPHQPNASKGKAFLKIGHMLQELGVLPIRREEIQPQIDHLIGQIDTQIREDVENFAAQLKKSNCALTTVVDQIRKIRNLQIWLKSQPDSITVLTINHRQICDYLDSLRALEPDAAYVRQTLKGLDRFYRFLLFHKKILINPCKRIHINREQLSLTVCSEYQFKKLIQFTKNPESDPEQAMLLSLILFFGFTIDDITYATVQIESDALCIVLRRKPTTKGRRFYNRQQVLKLPVQPRWFLQLQKRFYTRWLQLYSKNKKTYPRASLVLHKHGHHNRPLCKGFIRKRIHEATLIATGSQIPPRVLKQTCGHIYSQNQDASILARLGWSAQFAFHYTWLPRKLLPENPKLKVQKRN